VTRRQPAPAGCAGGAGPITREETIPAAEAFAASPAAGWIGNKFAGNTLLQRCMRCGAEQTLAFPPNIRGPADVPVGFDEKLFTWKRAFQVTHESCVESVA
jgi:hypothetical protein